MFVDASLLPSWSVSLVLLILACRYSAEGSTIVTATGTSLPSNSTIRTTSAGSVTVTSSLNVSEGSTPAFTYPGGSSTLSLASGYSCITSDDGSPDCWYTVQYSETDTNYVPGRSGAVHAWYANPYTSVSDVALRSQCASQFSSDYSEFIATASVVPQYTTSNHYVQPAYYASQWTFVATTPCCQTCYLSGGNVQVQYWPTPAPNPNVTAVVDQNGFTFVSPSVYVVFESLVATDLCGPVGKTYFNTTLSFAQSELSTSQGVVFSDAPWVYPPTEYTWTAFNYRDMTQANCTNVTSSYWVDYGPDLQGPTTTFVTWPTTSLPYSGFGAYAEDYVYTYNPCHPTMSVPTELYTVDPGWHSCLDGISAFYDPPRVLQPASDLTAVYHTATATPPLPETTKEKSKATNGATADPKTPTATSRPYFAPTHTDPLLQDPKTDSTPVSNLPNPDPTSHVAPGYPDSEANPTSVPTSQHSSSADPFRPTGVVDGSQPKVSQSHNEDGYGVPAQNSNTEDRTSQTAPTLLTSGPHPGSGDTGGILQDSHTAALTEPSLYVGDQIISAGAPSMTIGDNLVSYDGGTIHIGQSAVTLSNANGYLVPTTVTADGLTISVGPSPTHAATLPVIVFTGSKVTANDASEFVVGSQTLAASNLAVTLSGTKISLDPSRSEIVVGTSTGPWRLGSLIMNGFGSPSSMHQTAINGITYSEDATEAIISAKTYLLGSNVSPTAITIGSQTLVVGPNGVQTAATPSTFTLNGLTITTDASQAIISGTTYPLGETKSSTTLVIGDQTLVLGPSGIATTSSTITLNGLTVTMDASQAMIGGTTYTLGGTKSSTTLVIGGQTLVLGPGGISAEATLSQVTADGITFSMDATEAVVSGTTYTVGPGATPTTLVLGSESISLGPGGVGLASTTIAMPNATGTSFQYFTGEAAKFRMASSSLLGIILAGFLLTIVVL